MNILGISAYCHNPACCLLQDGELVAAVEEERFTRVKFDPRLPVRAIRYCLQRGRIGISDVDCIAYYEDPKKKLARQLWMFLQPGSKAMTLERLDKCLSDVTRHEREIRGDLGYGGRIVTVDHHLSHAASSYYFSGFQDAAVLTVDGVGEWATTTYGRAKGGSLEIFAEVEFPHSLGLFYAAVTAYLGFRVNSDEYKVMGLAPYGKPAYVDLLRQLIESKSGPDYQLNLDYFDFIRGDKMITPRLVELLGRPPREPESAIEAFHEDIARSAQVVLEEVLLEKARWLHGEVPSENLCMAGSVALNCVANRRILSEGPFKRLFVQPAAGDSGSCLGAAAAAHGLLTGVAPMQGRALENVLLGPSYSSDDVPLEELGIKALDFRGNMGGLIDAAVERLAAGKIVGWFQGGMEFGPRALGARSILADPRGPEMRDKINALVKEREAFRPFAPAVLEYRAAEHFELDHASPFMSETCQVRSQIPMPAITHVDGSARVQTVGPVDNLRLYWLLRRFEAKTGCPVLLNTSFNMRDEPIVCTPLDAIVCFVRAGMDALVIEDFVIDKQAVPDRFRAAAEELPRPMMGEAAETLLGPRVVRRWTL